MKPLRESEAYERGRADASRRQPKLTPDEFAQARASDMRVPMTRMIYTYYERGYEAFESSGGVPKTPAGAVTQASGAHDGPDVSAGRPRPKYEIAMRISPGICRNCERGDHENCQRMIGFHNCPCSCRHGRTTKGECAMYGCDCHEQQGRHGLPFSRRHRTSCRPWVLRERS